MNFKTYTDKVISEGEITNLFTVNGQPIKAVIARYVERNDVKGLAEFFRALLEDLAQI